MAEFHKSFLPLLVPMARVHCGSTVLCGCLASLLKLAVSSEWTMLLFVVYQELCV